MKLVGCIMVTVFSAAFGIVFAKREMKIVAVLEEMHCFLGKMGYGIRNRIPFNEIATGYMTVKNPKYICGTCREDIAEALSRISNEGICRDEARACSELLLMTGKSTDAREIEKYCADTLELVTKSLDVAKPECARKRGLYIKLGTAVGLLVCITVM